MMSRYWKYVCHIFEYYPISCKSRKGQKSKKTNIKAFRVKNVLKFARIINLYDYYWNKSERTISLWFFSCWWPKSKHFPDEILEFSSLFLFTISIILRMSSVEALIILIFSIFFICILIYSIVLLFVFFTSF